MKNWENNAVKYYKTHDPGVCPNCGSNNVEVTEHKNGTRYSITIMCKDCGNGDHLDGYNPDTAS